MAYVALRASPGKGEAHYLLQLRVLGIVLCLAPEENVAHESGGHFPNTRCDLHSENSEKQQSKAKTHATNQPTWGLD